MKRVIIGVILFVSAFMVFTCGFSEGKSMAQENVKMVAEVTGLGDKIEVEVLESDYTSGVHLVITHDATQYFDINGNKTSRTEIEVGDKVEIVYSGQVMLSFPPQIVAIKIRVCE